MQDVNKVEHLSKNRTVHLILEPDPHLMDASTRREVFYLGLLLGPGMRLDESEGMSMGGAEAEGPQGRVREWCYYKFSHSVQDDGKIGLEMVLGLRTVKRL